MKHKPKVNETSESRKGEQDEVDVSVLHCTSVHILMPQCHLKGFVPQDLHLNGVHMHVQNSRVSQCTEFMCKPVYINSFFWEDMEVAFTASLGAMLALVTCWPFP